jgi:hypothetical protein
MSDSLQQITTGSDPVIVIERLNTDKTRKDSGSESVYHVYFELSGCPPPEWRSIFDRKWKTRDPLHAASVEGDFLVMHCQLQEVPTAVLPFLKEAVSATNEDYAQYSRRALMAQEQRQEMWKQERNQVETMAASVHFD